MEKILITGASGFVGSHLVEEALRRDIEVYAGIRKTSSREYLKDERIRFVELDFEDKKSLADMLKKHRFDYIIQNAGVVSARKLEDYWRVNFEYLKNLVEAIYDAGVMPEKFIFISSAAAFGPARSDDLSDFLTEDDEPKPINTYGKSKLAAEQYLQQLHDFPYITFRPTGIYGPREKEIYIFFKMLNKHIEGLIGFRRQHLSFVYVKDLTKVVLDAVMSGITEQSYFISDGKYYAQEDLGKAGKRILQKWAFRIRIPVTIVKAIAWFMEQLGKGDGKYPTLNLEKVRIIESLNWKCDIEPLREDLNFQPRYDLEEGLEETIAWYKENGWL